MKHRNVVLTLLVFLVSLVLLAACDNSNQREAHRRREAESYVNNITYVKDKEANLCFAYSYQKLTQVPCDNVEKYIK